MIVVITDEELMIAEMLGRRRYQSNRSCGVSSQLVSGKTDDHERLGVECELIYARLFNLWPELVIRPRRGSADFVHDGWRVDVKGTRNPNGNLLVRPGKEQIACEYFALMICWPGKRYELIGYARAVDVFRKDTILNLGYGHTHFVPRHALLPNLPGRGFNGYTVDAGCSVGST